MLRHEEHMQVHSCFPVSQEDMNARIVVLLLSVLYLNIYTDTNQQCVIYIHCVLAFFVK